MVYHYAPIVIWSLYNCSKSWSILLVLSQIRSEWVLDLAKTAYFTLCLWAEYVFQSKAVYVL